MKKKGSDLKVGDRVKFTPSGWHSSITAEVITKDFRFFLKVQEPQLLRGAIWGLWEDHKYTLT